MTPLLSIFMPTCNGASFVREALESVIGNGLAAIEIVVVVDASTDDTVSIAETIRHPALRRVRQPPGLDRQRLRIFACGDARARSRRARRAHNVTFHVGIFRTMTRNISRLWLLCVAGLAAGAASAQVFECIDAKGARGYAQFCPPGTVRQREVLKESAGNAGTSGAGTAAPKSIDEQDVEFRKRLLERQEAEVKAGQEKAQAEEAERNCIEARAQSRSLEDGPRISRIDAVTGERVNFGDAELADELVRQRRVVADWCKG